MKVIRSLSEAQADIASVVTVGNFDGVHRGHSAILEATRERAATLGSRSVAITFDPLPLQLIAPDRAPVPISTLEQKIALIEQAGIDILLVQDFNKEFSQLSPEQFIQAYLAGPLRTRSVCVGHNFRFGHQHRGNIETLRSSKEPFDVVEVPPVIVGAETISSSRVRQLLVEGRVRHARRMLGRCYEIEGAIVSGSGRGKKVTVPTLNLSPANKLIPAHGVYLTRVAVDGAPYAESLTNIGVRPTFQERERTIETHVLDSLPPEGAGFARLRILRRLRDERQFPDAAALREQIAGDAAFARRYFKRVGGLRETTTVAGSNTDTR